VLRAPATEPPAADAVQQLAAPVEEGATVHADGLVGETAAGFARAIDEPARHRERGRGRLRRAIVGAVIVGGEGGFAEEVMLAVHGGSSG